MTLNSKYTMNTLSTTNDRYSFDGYTNSRIFYAGNETWRMELLTGDTAEEATTADDTEDYPIGIHEWEVTSPVYVGRVKLNLYACDDRVEYGCNSGGCVDIEKR